MPEFEKLLWHSNAPWSATGYANQTSIFTQLLAQQYKVAVSAFYGLEGAPMRYNDIPVFPGLGGDFGNDQNRLWINMGGAQGGTLGVFVDRTATNVPTLLDDSRDIEFVDVDEDGDPDLFTSNSSQISNQTCRWWINMGGLQGGTAGFFTGWKDQCSFPTPP
jgi:hypothetical protein